MTLTGITSNIPHGLDVRTVLKHMGPHRYLQVTLSAGHSPVEDWTLEMKVPAAIIGIYGAKYDAVSASRYKITPDPWIRAIPMGGKVNFGVLLGS
ncbi:MAG: hypothetical protein AAF615_04430 [Pseudomonadota bacterium]